MCRYLSIHSGIGSFDLALQRLHFWTPVCYVESNPRSIDVLSQRFRDDSLQDAPIWDDFATFDGRPWRGCVDCIAGIELAESGIEPGECATASSNKLINLVKEVEPGHVLWQLSSATKAAAIASADYLANGFEILGYRTAILKVRSSDLGADHRRTRIFVCAEMANATPADGTERIEEIDGRLSTPCRATRWTSAPRICRRTDGVADRMERLDALGRSTIPAMVAAVSTFLDSGIVF
jgi:DNA (cytosine-5)-methyltransferase 1